MEKEPTFKSKQDGGEKEGFGVFADKLDALQSLENGGRGVSCIKTIIFYLRTGDIGSVKAVCWNEADKIENYPNIKQYIKDKLFKGVSEKEISPHFRD